MVSSSNCLCICDREVSMNCLAGVLVSFLPFLSSSHSNVLQMEDVYKTMNYELWTQHHNFIWDSSGHKNIPIRPHLLFPCCHWATGTQCWYCSHLNVHVVEKRECWEKKNIVVITCKLLLMLLFSQLVASHSCMSHWGGSFVSRGSCPATAM